MKPQQQLPSQPFSSSASGLNQANREQVASSIIQSGRRPSPTDLPVASQRPDSRVGSVQQAPLPAPQQQPISVQRPIQQQQPPQQQQQNAQPQYQPRQILQQVLPSFESTNCIFFSSMHKNKFDSGFITKIAKLFDDWNFLRCSETRSY